MYATISPVTMFALFAVCAFLAVALVAVAVRKALA